MIINLADFNIEFLNTYRRHYRLCADYMIDENKTVDYSIIILEEEIDKELQESGEDYQRGYVEGLCFYRKFSEWIPKHGAFLLHSAVFDVDGEGVAFAAHSGTGKTTHMMLWQQLLGDKMTIVNGDKPIVRFFDDEPETPYAYGTPWNGKERLGCNMRTPLKHICFIERGATNSVEPMQKSDVVDLIFNQVYMPKDPIAVMNTMQLIDRLLSCCKLWKIKCNMDPSAAEVAYDAIIKNEEIIKNKE